MTSPTKLVPYTTYGRVPAVGVPLERTIPGGRVIKMAVGGADNNVYLIQCSSTKSSILIDAANDAPSIISLVEQECPRGLELIVTTHEHVDHWWALPDVVAATHAPTAASMEAQETLPVKSDRIVQQSDQLSIGQLTGEFIRASGHTEGSVLVAIADNEGRHHIFTGDSLFPGGLGKTPDQDAFTSLYQDITRRVFDVYPDDTIIYPGHGDDTTVGDERPRLEEWRVRGW